MSIKDIVCLITDVKLNIEIIEKKVVQVLDFTIKDMYLLNY